MADLSSILRNRPAQVLDRARLPASRQRQVHRQQEGVCDVYFVTAQQRAAAKRSLGIADIGETFDVLTTVKGGGVMGQADAVKLGIARALMEFNPELRKALKAEGLVTRDSRGKERKKYGQKGARARFQFSKPSCRLPFGF
jgi:small subunit ribosomal protein S9